MQASEQPDREPATGEPATGALQSPPETNERVVCIGDVHGNLAELEALLRCETTLAVKRL
jgi:hypothetical protein